jgi:putative SOS response-associated peptidase YedK
MPLTTGKIMGKKTKLPYALVLNSGALCALRRSWVRLKPRGGDALEAFTIMTTRPCEALEPRD